MQKSSDLRSTRLRQTWQDIHEIAAEDCLKHGPEGVNAADIANRAGVSPRTFFNYFATKEDAILGLGRPELRPEHIETFINDTAHQPLLRVCLLTVAVVGTALGPDVDHQRRFRLVEKYPELLMRMTNTILQSRDHILRELVLEAEELWLGIDGMPEKDDEAQALVMLAFTVVAFAWRRGPTRLAQDAEQALSDTIDVMVSMLGKSL